MENSLLGVPVEKLAELFNQKVTRENLRKHCLATRAIMEKLAQKKGEDPFIWGWAGLLHDLDFEETKEKPELHGEVTARLLAKEGVKPEIIAAIKAHNAEHLGVERRTPLDFALTCAESITGLIVATALVQPDKKLQSVAPGSVLKRMKEKAFARNVNREHIMLCEKLGLNLEEFVSLSLEAMQEISKELGL